MKKTAWIVPSTHWDREWVMTQGQFQVRLADMVNHLIDICESHPEYRFYFDGQTVALEDYLEIHPENRSRLRKLLESKQIMSGPWYGLADQFLQGGEATIRNLLEGRRSSLELGGTPLMLGYVPDSFGSSSALPMLLREFDIAYAIIGRGCPRELMEPTRNEFFWKSSNDDTILAADFSYSGGIFLSYPDIWQDIQRCHPAPEVALSCFLEAAEQQAATASGQHLYFPVGIDHMEARESLIEIVDYINHHQDTYELKFGMPTDYLAGVKASAGPLAVYSGEQCGSDEKPMDLNGTLSSHVRLKQANFHCENLLAGAVEPLAVLAMRFAGRTYPEGMLRKMWKMLLANQTHDSICGCSIDQVHRDMLTRYDFIKNTSAYLIKDLARNVVDLIDTKCPNRDFPAVTVFNLLGRKRNVPVKAIVAVPYRCKEEKYQLCDELGNPVSASITRVADKTMDLESIYMMPEQLTVLLSKDADEAYPDDQVFSVFEIDFVAENLPSCGWRTWWLTPFSQALEHRVKCSQTSMENEFIRIDFLPDGSFDLTDLNTHHCFHKVMKFVDREEAGNLYDHFSLPEIQEFDSSGIQAEISMIEKLPHRNTCRIKMNLPVPCSLENETSRSTQIVDLPITVYASLYAGIPRLELSIECDNTAKDHCLHAVFQTGLKASEVKSDVAFDMVSRKVDSSDKTWRHRPVQHMIDISDENCGLSVMPRGLYSQLATMNNDGSVDLHVTLLRCAGHLGPAAGADYPTPDGQSPGKHRFEIAIMPHAGIQEANCMAAALDYTQPIYPIASLPHDGTLPGKGSAIDIPGAENLVYSCLKKAENDEHVIFRCWNPAKQDIEGKFSGLLFKENSVSAVRADETEIDSKKLVIKQQGLTTLKL